MKVLYKLKDDQFPIKGEFKIRNIARGIVINDKNEVLMLHLLADDIFGHRDYYETPGGGLLPNESAKEAVIREVKEETGYETEIIDELGIVEDDYNLINTHNINHYFLLKIINKSNSSLEEYEKHLIKEIVFKNFNEAIKLIEVTKDTPISILVKRRELPIYKLALKKVNKIN